MTTVFEPKRDAWIVALIWAGALLCVYGALVQFTSAGPFLLKVAVLLFLGSGAVFMVWILYQIDYTLTDDNLVVRCGPVRYRVPIVRIDSVRPSRNPLSSPAPSLDRLLIKWNDGRKRIIISPARKTEFLRELDMRCAQLRMEGDSLVRVSTE
jgi:hypothetical protein